MIIALDDKFYIYDLIEDCVTMQFNNMDRIGVIKLFNRN